ncbi:MAG: 6-bladed beta-propeller [Candidatus Aminicenantes bacterium]|nr:6-bladed beta-propeller [Candidatus Aminicenantes bacterium]
MKFTVSLIMAIVLLTPALNGQKVITNPEKPATPNSGQVIIPQKVMDIAGESADFYFKWPNNIKIGKDGSIFVSDKKQLLKFTPEGRFILNYYKSGLGPGEAVSISNYFLLEDNSIVLHNQAPNKVVTFDSNGKLLSEIRLPFDKYFYFFFMNSDDYYFHVMNPQDTKGSAKMVDMNYEFLAVSRQTPTSLQKKIILPLQTYLYNSPGAYIVVTLVFLSLEHFRDNLFYLSHTPEYRIKLVDFSKNELISEITRKYKRVAVTDENKKYLSSGQFSLDGKLYKSPTPEYLNDIQSLHVVNNKLLVITSTTDKEKGVLVDVYDEFGKYTNCFYLKLPTSDSWLRLEQGAVEISGDALFTIEQDKDENWMISKYRAPLAELLK